MDIDVGVPEGYQLECEKRNSDNQALCNLDQDEGAVNKFCGDVDLVRLQIIDLHRCLLEGYSCRQIVNQSQQTFTSGPQLMRPVANHEPANLAQNFTITEVTNADAHAATFGIPPTTRNSSGIIEARGRRVSVCSNCSTPYFPCSEQQLVTQEATANVHAQRCRSNTPVNFLVPPADIENEPRRVSVCSNCSTAFEDYCGHQPHSNQPQLYVDSNPVVLVSQPTGHTLSAQQRRLSASHTCGCAPDSCIFYANSMNSLADDTVLLRTTSGDTITVIPNGRRVIVYEQHSEHTPASPIYDSLNATGNTITDFSISGADICPQSVAGHPTSMKHPTYRVSSSSPQHISGHQLSVSGPALYADCSGKENLSDLYGSAFHRIPYRTVLNETLKRPLPGKGHKSFIDPASIFNTSPVYQGVFSKTETPLMLWSQNTTNYPCNCDGNIHKYRFPPVVVPAPHCHSNLSNISISGIKL